MSNPNNQASQGFRNGFTLLEILLVVAAIAILAGIVIVAINPAKQLADTRDAQRRSDVNSISTAITQYLIKTGSYPPLDGGVSCDSAISYESAAYAICATSHSCEGVSLDEYLIPDYIAGIPLDPSVPGSGGFSGYTAMILENNRLLVCAPFTEEASETISVTR